MQPATKERAQKTAPWVALAMALGVPLLTYLQTRAETQRAKAEAEAAQTTAAESQWKAGRVGSAQEAVYSLLAKELERVATDANTCHQRVDKLAEGVEALAAATRRTSRGEARETAEVASERVIEQRAISRASRPAEDRKPLPKRKGDVAPWDPLAGALK